jgi:hypothetical protein
MLFSQPTEKYDKYIMFKNIKKLVSSLIHHAFERGGVNVARIGMPKVPVSERAKTGVRQLAQNPRRLKSKVYSWYPRTSATQEAG